MTLDTDSESDRDSDWLRNGFVEFALLERLEVQVKAYLDFWIFVVSVGMSFCVYLVLFTQRPAAGTENGGANVEICGLPICLSPYQVFVVEVWYTIR